MSVLPFHREEGLRPFLPVFQAAEQVARAAPRCGCGFAATKVDALGQLWCDLCGEELVLAKELDTAPVVRAVEERNR